MSEQDEPYYPGVDQSLKGGDHHFTVIRRYFLAIVFLENIHFSGSVLRSYNWKSHSIAKESDERRFYERTGCADQ